MATFAQEGVNFEDLTFDEALAKAKAENNSCSWIVTRVGVVLVNTWLKRCSRRKVWVIFSIRGLFL